MARQYYFADWEEALYLMGGLDCYDADYSLEYGIDAVDESRGHIVTVFDEEGVNVAERIISFIREYPYEQYERDRATAIANGDDPRCIMSYHACLSYEEWEADCGEWQEAWDEMLEAEEAAIELGEDELLGAFATAAEIAMGECDEIGAELALEFAKFFGACRG